jgi:hypothetical protein
MNGPTVPLSNQRPNLFLLMLKHHFQLLDLARASRQHPFVLWDMILGHPVKSEQAVQVVGTLNELCGTTYALVQMEVNVEE